VALAGWGIYILTVGSLHVGLFAFDGDLPVGGVRYRGKLWTDRQEHASLSGTVGELISLDGTPGLSRTRIRGLW
jgi:hypothetical protein